ncbi:glycoside hydrolase family 97 protein [Christiangramia sp. SM2212]|uniref:Glycoside hydrolase family 97 protein n=1 Tax=Christiangramia sediminicola TaxID=3073267 RepID=A0ABU1EL96_9FLAO|nr:glycoside hydrolase family 97 protein [Christiangramia sp. SM2212]MDR5589033.1 glycoside hydrolase family 97 protein [Christiangramia sp. SM2212]
MNKNVFIFILIFFSGFVHAKSIDLLSPKGDLKIEIEVGEQIFYSIFLQDQPVLLKNRLQLELEDEVLGFNSTLIGTKKDQVSEVFKPVTPLKFSSIQNHYNVVRLNFKEGFSVEFRAYDGGFAYRFITSKRYRIKVLSEDVQINLASTAMAHLQQTETFKTSYEYAYTHLSSKEFSEETTMSTLPVLLETDNDITILISESDLRDYPAMFLKGNAKDTFQGVFPKEPLEVEPDGDRSQKILKEADYIALTDGSRNFPWRYFLISLEEEDILTNTMTAKLAGKPLIENTSWLKPGQASWEWWNGASPYDVDFVAGYNEETYRYFIDFASEFGIPYIIMDEGWAKTTTDPYTPNPDIDLFALIKYGKEKNVDIVLWLTWLTVENNMQLFEKFHDWGIAGVKIDFMDRSDQWMVNFYERVAKKAAENEIFVDFHGAFKPAGLEYLYPNIFSYEGVLGMEQMERATPENSIYLPFIRNAVGGMDYTPGAMLSMQPEFYYSRRPNSASIGTRSYQMALFVIFESALQMLADNPTNYYKNRDCTEFITSVPTTWDETVVLDAEIGKNVIVAKRKGNSWFIGGMNGTNEDIQLDLELDFLPKNKSFEMVSFEDGINAGRQAMDYKKIQTEIDSNTKYKIRMVRNGGWAAVINELDK